MIPSNLKYPDFVPDQLLTSDNLNQLFSYLDEQGRTTRTNLLGIGIVCGFEVQTAADGTSITITKGTGIASEGYLVAQDNTTYTEIIDFDPALEIYYDKFLTAAHVKKFDLWELKQTAAVEGTVPLTLSFLNGGGSSNDQKVVLLFVELLQELNKNCNPESCDDKGITINVNLRPLLIRKQDVDAFNLSAGIGEIYFNQTFATMPEMRIKRFDVVATAVSSSAGLFTAYKRILTTSFIQSVEDLLTSAWTQFSPVVGSEYGNVNPFASMAENFAFLNNGSIVVGQLRTIQYVYDHFSDLLAAYEEFRHTGMDVLSTCCPDASLFPRHLLLDLAIHNNDQLHSSYRHYFRYSPLFQKRDLYLRLRSLFRRMVLMMSQFQVPAVAGAADNPDSFIRITPSRLDSSGISCKAIPFYYLPATPSTNPLFKHWSFDKTAAADADQNLSYNAGIYSSKDFVVSPLNYDLEPYNFLRIEGHLGKSYSHVLSNLKNRIKERRLPIDVIALSTGSDAAGTEILDPKLVKDIQTQYEVLKSEVLCCLKTQLNYWGNLQIKDYSHYGILNLAAAAFIGIADTFTAFNRATPTDRVAAPFLGRDVAMVQPSVTAGGESVTGISGSGGIAGAGANVVVSTKGSHLSDTLGTIQSLSLAQEYLRYQALGDFNLSKIPAPVSVTLDTSSISHYALIILDEIEEIIQLLEAENPLALNIQALETHRDTLEKTLTKLAGLVSKELDARKPFMKIKAYVGESQTARVDAIAAAMPDLGDENVNKVVLLLLNLSESQKTSMANQLLSQRGNRSAQVSILNTFFTQIDKDGMQVPANKDVTVVDDPFLAEMRERLKGFNCLCSLTGLSKLRQVLQSLIDEFKQANLLSNFAVKHPGIQHKAGVTMGGTFIVVYHKAGTPADSPGPDATYASVSASLADGIVIADFYLPYLSYSIAPPIVYQVIDAEPEPEAVELELEPNSTTESPLVYSVGDEKSYNFTHVPDNGTLTNAAEANGVTSPSADVFVFTPSKAKPAVGDNLKADLTFTYVKKGVVSAPVTISVFNLPTVSIKPADEITDIPVGAPVNLIADVQFADRFNWTVKDPNGTTTSIAENQNLEEFTPLGEGVYVFTLQVTQSQTGAIAISNAVEVTVRKVEEQPTKTCSSPATVVDDYRKLPGLDERNFEIFNSGVLTEFGINDLFKVLSDVVVRDEQTQLDFFTKPFRNQATLPENITAWLDLLASRAVDARRANQRLLSLETYRVIADLLLYIQCLKNEDLGKTEEQIFANMILHFRGQRTLGTPPGILALTLSPAEKERVEMFRKDIDQELERVRLNNRILAKPKYERSLQSVLEIFR